MEQTLEIAIQPELTEIVVKSGLEKATIYAATFAPFMTKVKECSDKAATINKTDPTPLDAKLAREIRLVMVKNRTATEKKKDESKAALLAESNLIQSLNNVVINTSKLVEADLEAVEKFSERKEAERVAALKAERVELLKDYVDDATIFPLGTMNEDQFSTMLEGYKLTKRQQEEAAAKLEAERIEKEAAEKLEQERIRQENEKLKAEAEEAAKEAARIQQEKEDKADAFIKQLLENGYECRSLNYFGKDEYGVSREQLISLTVDEFNNRMKEVDGNIELKEAHAKKIAEIEAANKLAREKAEAEHAERDRLAKVESDRLADIKAKRSVELKPYIMFIRDYNAMLNMDEESYQNELAAVDQGARDHYAYEAEQKAKADKLASEQIEREQMAKIEADRIAAENAKLAAELEEKKKAEREAAEKLAADIATKKLADDIAAKAPDKEKLTSWIADIEIEYEPMQLSEASEKVMKDIVSKFASFKVWALSQVEAL